MVCRYNIYYNCDISKIPDNRLKQLSVELWTSDKKLLQQQVKKNGNDIFIIVTKVTNSKGEYAPVANIQIGKKIREEDL